MARAARAAAPSHVAGSAGATGTASGGSGTAGVGASGSAGVTGQEWAPPVRPARPAPPGRATAGTGGASTTAGTGGAGTTGTAGAQGNPDAGTTVDGNAGDFPTGTCAPGAIFCDDFEEYKIMGAFSTCPAPSRLCDFTPMGSTTATWLGYHFHGPPYVVAAMVFGGKQVYQLDHETGHPEATDIIKESPDGVDLWPGRALRPRHGQPRSRCLSPGRSAS